VSIDMRETVLACGQLLADYNGGDTVVMDLRKLSAWTDFFIVTSATSSTHMRGLLRHLEEHLAEQGMVPIRRPRLAEDEEWCLVDFGDFVVHIMSLGARAFYELEKLWFEAELSPIAPRGPAGSTPEAQ
jgi:ribosome-associated protein